MGRSTRCASLGGSVNTRNDQPLRARLVHVKSLEQLSQLPPDEVEGRLVVQSPHGSRAHKHRSRLWGCRGSRAGGAIAAAKAGAIGALVRSMTHALDTLPHTGAMYYEEGIDSVPSAAISTVDASWLANQLKGNPDLEVVLEMNCRAFPDVEQGNVIGEWRGSELPNEIITLGGHLDSWDIGEGAHDDGAGIVHTLEVLRILKALEYTPRRTIRFVLFINEENGNRGGKTYAARARRPHYDHRYCSARIRCRGIRPGGPA